MADLDALALQFGGVPAQSDDELDRLARQFGGRSVNDTPKPLTALQAGGAVATGFNRGLTALAGLPVDTALNVADLARAAYGYGGAKLGALTPDQLPAPLDRSQYVGSSANIAKQLERSPVGAALIDNPRPDVPTARYLNAGGMGLGSSMAGTPSTMAMQFASGVAGQAANEAGLPPEYSILASMGPQAATTGLAAGTRGVMRGGEAGRQAMAQRATDFQNAGVNPTVGLATGNRQSQVIESLLSRAPGGAGAMAAKADEIRGQLQASANAARDQVSPVYGPAQAGEAMRQGITDYRGRQQAIYGNMVDRGLNAIPPGMTFPVSSMLARGGDTLSQIPGAPNVTRVVNQPLGFTQDVLSALNKDAAPQSAQLIPSPILGPGGQPFMTQAPATPGGLPIQGLRDLRTRIGQVAFPQNPLTADANAGAMKALYGGAKQDLTTAGALADQQRMAMGQPPAVLSQFQRADRFYTQTQNVLDRVLSPIYVAGDAGAEKSYARLESAMQNTGSTVTKAMTALPLPVRQTVTATAIDRLGKATPGQQNAAGDAFSPQTFLTNWSKITPDAKAGLFNTLPNGSIVRSKLDYIAQAVERMKSAASVYANPSGTAGAATLYGSAAGIGSGAALMATGHYGSGAGTMAAILGSMALARLGAAAMTSPKVVSWLADTTKIRPEQMQQHLQRLSVLANSERDPQQRAAMQGLAQSLQNEFAAPQ